MKMNHLNSQSGMARGKLMVILFVVVVGVVLGSILFRVFTKQDTTVTPPAPIATSHRIAGDQFMQALAANKPDTAFDLMTPAGQLTVGGREAWRQTVSTSFGSSSSAPAFVGELPIQDSGELYKDQDPRLFTYGLKLFNADWETSLTIIKTETTWKIDNVITEAR